MDNAELVDKDLRIGRDIIGLLAAANLAIDDAFCAYVPQVEEWRLVLSSPAVKTLGVHDSSSRRSRRSRRRTCRTPPGCSAAAR